MNDCLSKNIEAISHFAWPLFAFIVALLFYKQFQLLFIKLISLLDRISVIKSGKTEVILTDATNSEIKEIKGNSINDGGNDFEKKAVQSLSNTFFKDYFLRKEGKIQGSPQKNQKPLIIDAVFHNQNNMILLETVKGKKESPFMVSCHLARAVNYLKGAKNHHTFGLLAITEDEHVEENPDFFVLKYDAKYTLKNKNEFLKWLDTNDIEYSR